MHTVIHALNWSVPSLEIIFLGATKSCTPHHNGFCCVSLDCMATPCSEDVRRVPMCFQDLRLDGSDSFSSIQCTRFRALRILESKRRGMQIDSGVAMRVHVGEPAFRPAYGSPGMLAAGNCFGN